MKTSLIVTFSGLDRPGLVDDISKAALEFAANWEESRTACLAGHFAGIVHFSVVEERADALTDALRNLEDLAVTVARGVNAGPPRAHRTLILDIVGTDHEGIVQEIAHALSSQGVNILEMETTCTPAPHAGDMLFGAIATLAVPSSIDDDQLRVALEQIAADVMVELNLLPDDEIPSRS